MKRAVLLALVLLALGASGAQAAARPFGAYEDGLYRIGIAYWNEGQPKSCPYITRRVEDRFGEMEGAAGWGGSCELIVAEDEFGPDATPSEACRVVVHEVGHLLGHGHSADRTNIMFPGELSGAIVPGCVDPLASMAALPPLPLALWPQEVAALGAEETRWSALHARCRSKRCWGKSRRLRSYLNDQWPVALARQAEEPVYR